MFHTGLYDLQILNDRGYYKYSTLTFLRAVSFTKCLLYFSIDLGYFILFNNVYLLIMFK